MNHLRPVLSTFALCLGASAILVAACQNTSDDGGGSGGAGGTSAAGGQAGAGGDGAAGSAGATLNGGVFQPAGCGFQIAGRMEYTDFAQSSPMVGATPNIRRVRLGLGGSVLPGAAGHADPAHTIAVAWQTDDGTLASEIAWGSDPDPSKWDAAARVAGVTWKTPPGAINGMGEERMHETYVCGLTADTTYYYRVGGGAAGQEVWSDVYPFHTAPTDPGATVTIAVTGDARGENNNAWQLLQKRVKAISPTLQLFSGDMIDLAPDQGEWEEWLDRAWKDDTGAQSALGTILTLAAHGNHDNHTALFYGNVTLPQDPTNFGQYTELFYSFDAGPVHVVVFDDSFIANNLPDAATLGDWLEKDLTAADQNRGNVPWVIAVSHRPAYSSSTHGKDNDVIRVRTFVTPVWDKHHVDLSLAGHDHNYERSQPLTGPSDSPTVHTDAKDGTVYMTCAGAGADPYPAGMSSFTAKSRDYTSGSIGLYSVLTATKSTLKVEAHALTAAGDDPIFDTYTITK